MQAFYPFLWGEEEYNSCGALEYNVEGAVALFSNMLKVFIYNNPFLLVLDMTIRTISKQTNVKAMVCKLILNKYY